MRPDGGKDGGNIVIAGSPQDVKNCKKSITGRFL